MCFFSLDDCISKILSSTERKMEHQGERRRSRRKRPTDGANASNKKQRAEDDHEVQLQHTQNSNNEESETGSQLVPYQNSNSFTMCTRHFECGEIWEKKARLHGLMVQNICQRCTTVGWDCSQHERTIHIIFEDEKAADNFVGFISGSGFIHINKSRDTYVFSVAKNCIVTVSWIHDPDDEDAANVHMRELEQLSNGRESFFVLTLPGRVTSKSRVEIGQVVPIGSLSFSSCGESSRTSLAESRPTFNTQLKCNAELNALLQSCTRKDVLHKHTPRAVCIDTDQHVPFSKTYGVVIDKHPTFVRTLVEQFGTRQLLCVMVAITEHVDHDGVPDQKAMQNAITMLHTFLAAGIDTVFPHTGQDTSMLRRLEQPLPQKQPITTGFQTSRSHMVPVDGCTFSLPDTPNSPDVHRPPLQTCNLVTESKKPSDAVLLKVASQLSEPDAPKIGVILGLDMTRVDNILRSYSQHPVEERIRQVLVDWMKERGKDATVEVLEDALRSIRRSDVADDLNSYVSCYTGNRSIE